MHDIKFIKTNPDEFDAGLTLRGLDPLAEKLLLKDEIRRKVITQSETLVAERNVLSKEIGMAMKHGKKDKAEELKQQVAKSKEEVTVLENKAKELIDDLNRDLMAIPNLPYADTPKGTDESDNEEIRTYGTIKQFDFTPKEHYELGENLGQMDFLTATKISGSRFVILRKNLARLERALSSFMLDTHIIEHELEEVQTPVIVNSSALYGTGQLPKFGEDLYKIENSDFWLIPTAEVSITNQFSNTIIDEEKLPIRMTALTQCFRSEAGSAGRDTKGMLRQHQFAKVEMVTLSKPSESDNELERMTGCAENILKKLDIPYRVVRLCTGDLGFSARKTYDIEVWLPGQNTYREISSCSTTGEFQARRMKARFRKKSEKNTEFVHTLNGSGIAIGRCLIAVMENYQQADGSIIVPEVLRPYMGGLEVIS